MTDGGTRKAKGTQAMVVLGQACRGGSSQMRGCIQPEVRCELALSRRLPDAMPPRKASREVGRARTKTDTGGQVENTKAIGRTLEKELGKMAP